MATNYALHLVNVLGAFSLATSLLSLHKQLTGKLMPHTYISCALVSVTLAMLTRLLCTHRLPNRCPSCPLQTKCLPSFLPSFLPPCLPPFLPSSLPPFRPSFLPSSQAASWAGCSPLAVQSVAWVSCQSYLLATAAALGYLNCRVHWHLSNAQAARSGIADVRRSHSEWSTKMIERNARETGDGGGRGDDDDGGWSATTWTCLGLFFFTTSVLSKVASVSVVALAIAMDLYVGHHLCIAATGTEETCPSMQSCSTTAPPTPTPRMMDGADDRPSVELGPRGVALSRALRRVCSAVKANALALAVGIGAAAKATSIGGVSVELIVRCERSLCTSVMGGGRPNLMIWQRLVRAGNAASLYLWQVGWC